MDQKTCDEIRRICGLSYAYVATPYSKFPGGVVKAHSEACRAAGELMARGVPVFCPIAHSHPIAMTGTVPVYDHQFWMRVDEPMMRGAACLVIVEMDGWDKSDGILHEMEFFDRMGKPFFHIPWDVTENEK